MANDNIVPMPSAMQPTPVIIDDSRLKTLWDQQHRRQNWIVGGAVATALLIAAALVVMAFRINSEPPKVEVAAPVINIPEQAAPVVNITNPAPTINVQTPNVPAPVQLQQPAMTPRTGESKVVTEYETFTTVTVGDHSVITGWNYKNSNDKAPYHQHCYARLNSTSILELAADETISPVIGDDARKLGLPLGTAMTYVKSCRWFAAELRDPTR